MRYAESASSFSMPKQIEFQGRRISSCHFLFTSRLVSLDRSAMACLRGVSKSFRVPPLVHLSTFILQRAWSVLASAGRQLPAAKQWAGSSGLDSQESRKSVTKVTQKDTKGKEDVQKVLEKLTTARTATHQFAYNQPYDIFLRSFESRPFRLCPHSTTIDYCHIISLSCDF
jgi:hypothetical protein